MKTIVIASGNKNKFLELQYVAQDYPVRLLTPGEAMKEYSLPPYESPIENGNTFYENACIKAQACAEWSKLPSLADDSGVEVDALGGAPGIYSARYGGEGLSDDQRIDVLLKDVERAEEKSSTPLSRAARFKIALALYDPVSQGTQHSIASLEGVLLSEKKGDGGFGYDPIIKIDCIGKTLAEISKETLFEIGFRGKAARELFSKLENL